MAAISSKLKPIDVAHHSVDLGVRMSVCAWFAISTPSMSDRAACHTAAAFTIPARDSAIRGDLAGSGGSNGQARWT